MAYFLRFYIDLETEMTRKTSIDWLGMTRDEAGLSETATHDRNGMEIIETESGVHVILPGLCAHQLEAETLEEAIEEAETTTWPYGDIGYNEWAIFEGEYLRELPFGDGVAFRPSAVVHRKAN